MCPRVRVNGPLFCRTLSALVRVIAYVAFNSDRKSPEEKYDGRSRGTTIPFIDDDGDGCCSWPVCQCHYSYWGSVCDAARLVSRSVSWSLRLVSQTRSHPRDAIQQQQQQPAPSIKLHDSEVLMGARIYSTDSGPQSRGSCPNPDHKRYPYWPLLILTLILFLIVHSRNVALRNSSQCRSYESAVLPRYSSMFFKPQKCILRRARLELGWVTVFGRVHHLRM